MELEVNNGSGTIVLGPKWVLVPWSKEKESSRNGPRAPEFPAVQHFAENEAKFSDYVSQRSNYPVSVHIRLNNSKYTD